MGSSSDKGNKNLYIGISIFSILLVLIILILFYSMYKNGTSLFAAYDPSSNQYIADSGNNGLQYINLSSGLDAYIDSDSSAATQKESMIQRALSSLETSGISNGYLDLQNTSSSSNFSMYVIIIVILILVIGGIVTYASFQEDKQK